MALSYYFSEPFFPFKEFDRLFDEAFNARTSGTQLAYRDRDRDGRHLQNNASRPLRPRFVPITHFPDANEHQTDADRSRTGWTCTKTARRTS